MRRPAVARVLVYAPIRFGSVAFLFAVQAAWAQSPAPPGSYRPQAALVEPAAPLNLHQALALAFAANPELAVAAREVEATQAAVEQSGARPNPELAVEVEDTRSLTRTTTVQISQPIELGGKRAARIGAAERERDLATVDLRARRSELRANVTATFHAVLAAQERVKLAADTTDLARRASEAAAKRVLAGKVSPVEETKARVAEAGARLDAAQAQAELRATRQSLAATWGNLAPRFGRAEAPGGDSALAALPTPEVLAARVASSPALQRAQIEVQRRTALSEGARASQVPDLNVSLGLKRDNALGYNQVIVALAIPLPVFDTRQGALLEALRREDKSRDELVATQLRLSSEAQQARDRLEAARTEAQMLRDDVLPGAQSAYDAATKGFELGKFDFLDVLDAQRTFFAAKSQYLRALAETYRAAADIDRLLGDAAEPSALPQTKPQE